MKFLTDMTYHEDKGMIEVELNDPKLIHGFILVLEKCIDTSLKFKELEKAKHYLSMLIDLKKAFADIGERKNAREDEEIDS